MVKRGFCKPQTRVRFPYPAPNFMKLCKNGGGFHILEMSKITGNLYCPLCGEEKGQRKIKK